MKPSIGIRINEMVLRQQTGNSGRRMGGSGGSSGQEGQLDFSNPDNSGHIPHTVAGG
jgi:hypothetical protein